MARLGNVGDDTTRGGASWAGVRTGGIRDMDSEVLNKTTSGVGEGDEVELRCSARRVGTKHVVGKGQGGAGVLEARSPEIPMFKNGPCDRHPILLLNARPNGERVAKAGTRL